MAPLRAKNIYINLTDEPSFLMSFSTYWQFIHTHLTCIHARTCTLNTGSVIRWRKLRGGRGRDEVLSVADDDDDDDDDNERSSLF